MLRIHIAFCLALTQLAANDGFGQTFTEPGRFSAETLFNGNGTISVEFDPGGRLLTCEKQGRILVAAPDGRGGFSPPAVFADIRSLIFTTGECGLLGLALDPDYARNRFLYVLHTTTSDQRVVRLQARADFLAAETEAPTVVLSGLPRNAVFHKAGDLHFRPGEPDHLYLSLGDDGKEDSAKNLDAYPGKILKVHKTTGLGAADNPFYSGDGSSIRSRVWASGFRNPFRFTFHPDLPGILYVAEDGGPLNTREREDRISWVKRGADCAWSLSAANAGGTSAWFAPTDAKCKVLATDAPTTVGIAIARRGAFGTETGAGILYASNLGYPSQGGYAVNGSIRRWRIAGDEGERLEAIAADGTRRFVTGVHAVDIEFGPDGHLYASSSFGDAAIGGWYVFRRVRAAGGSTALSYPGEASGAGQGNIPVTKGGVTRGGRWFLVSGQGSLGYERIDARGRRISLAP